MKFTMNVECTPEEARSFFGLPDVQAFQGAMLKEFETRMNGAMSSMDPAAMMKMWFPTGATGGMQAMQDMQKMFWSNMQQAAQNNMQMAGLSTPANATTPGPRGKRQP